jgi:hypothetical protein
LEVVPKASNKFLGSKIRYLDRYKYPKKTFFEFISSISWGLRIGTKGEFRIFEEEKFNFSPLIA